MTEHVKIKARNLSFSYNGKMILDKTTMDFTEHRITAIVGPSGSGKSTFLLTLNRLWETMSSCTMQGTVMMKFDDQDNFLDIYQRSIPVTRLRRKVGMVFQAPNPLPMSIYKNVAFPLKLAGRTDKEMIRSLVVDCLKKVGLWQEVHDRLDSSALELSGGQQQRLCIARALILQPEVLLLDEPTSSLDSKAATAIEHLLVELKSQCTILVVSHYLDQVQRIADSIVTLNNGYIREYEFPMEYVSKSDRSP